MASDGALVFWTVLVVVTELVARITGAMHAAMIPSGARFAIARGLVAEPGTGPRVVQRFLRRWVVPFVSAAWALSLLLAVIRFARGAS